jgi:hypothetical protein
MAVTLDLLKKLHDGQVEFVLVGGLAAVFHGAPTPTEDIDIAIPFSLENLTKILNVLEPLHLRYRMRPDLPQIFNEPATRRRREGRFESAPTCAICGICIRLCSAPRR